MRVEPDLHGDEGSYRDRAKPRAIPPRADEKIEVCLHLEPLRELDTARLDGIGASEPEIAYASHETR